MTLFDHLFKHLIVFQKYSATYISHLLTLFLVFGNVKQGLSWLIIYDILTYKQAKVIILLLSSED